MPAVSTTETHGAYLGRFPRLDRIPDPPTACFHRCRSHWETAVQIAFVELDVTGKLGNEAVTIDQFRTRLGFKADRPAIVFASALLAGEYLTGDVQSLLSVPPAVNRFFGRDASLQIEEYVLLGRQNPAAREFIERLKNDEPRNEGGISFVHGEKVECSKMENPEAAVGLTRALEGRAKIVAPYLSPALNLPRGERKVVWDVGCGSGVYTASLLQEYENLSAVCTDSEPVLAYAQEQFERYGVAGRVRAAPGDMFRRSFAGAERPDYILLSNVLHDWDSAECFALVKHLAQSLNDNGEIIIHDVLMDSPHTGKIDRHTPYYGIDLFSFTFGRAYYFRELIDFMESAGLRLSAPPVRTAIDGWLLRGARAEDIGLLKAP